MHPDDELASLRRLLDALESGSMMLLLNGKDVTQEEVAKLKPDIEYLLVAPHLGATSPKRGGRTTYGEGGEGVAEDRQGQKEDPD